MIAIKKWMQNQRTSTDPGQTSIHDVRTSTLYAYYAKRTFVFVGTLSDFFNNNGDAAQKPMKKLSLSLKNTFAQGNKRTSSNLRTLLLSVIVYWPDRNTCYNTIVTMC